MKTIVNEINGRKDFPIFDGTNEQIFNWMNQNIDALDLSEPYSCDVSIDGDIVAVSGDEDYVVFRIIDVKIIKL